MKAQPRFKNMRRWGLLVVGSLLGLLNPSQSEPVEGASLGGPSHIGTFEGSTTFTTGSSNGINPGLYLEVMDKYGNYTEYTSEDGVITLPDTQEGAYVTQAKLLGKTKYRDQDTGELLDQWEAGRKLTLESVQMPVLTTTGKNLFDEINGSFKEKNSVSSTTGEITYYPNHVGVFENYIPVKPNTTYTLSGQLTDGNNPVFRVAFYQKDKAFNKTKNQYVANNGGGNRTSYTFTTSENEHYIRFSFGAMTQGYFQLEEGTIATKYEPFKSNILSTSEVVTLRGIGEARDELDLLTGEVTQRVGEVVLDGTQDGAYDYVPDESLGILALRLPKILDIKNDGINLYGLLSDKYSSVTNKSPNNICSYNGRIMITKELSELESFNTSDKIKLFLSQNPITIQYPLAENTIKTVGLNATYSFQPVTNREVYISGNILPLVCSVTIPTEPLTFVLNPNAEADQQFIAPEFTITNHTPTSIYLELSRFEQLTQVLTDVLPEAHDDWSQLDRAKSKEMALALVPQPSAGWLALEEGPRYVAEDSNYYLGEVKANSSVDFTFTAHHGRAFVEALNPQYRLSFIFDFFDR